LRHTKAKLSPRALRYEFEPGQPVRLVLEPWEKVIPLKGSAHNYEELRVIRTWGRRRLRLLEPLLPYADSVDVYLKGRALPSFYAVQLPGITFLAGLSGWTDQAWTGAGGFDRMSSDEGCDTDLLERALQIVRLRVALPLKDLAQTLGVGLETAGSLLFHLCRQGRLIFDVERREYRARELFAV